MVEMMETVATDVCGGGVPQSGHWVPEEQSDYLAGELLDFFASE